MFRQGGDGGPKVFDGLALSDQETFPVTALTPVERVRKRFEHWRRTREKRSRIPEQLWNAAVTVARSYGVNSTARVLGLDYYELKKRLDTEPGAAGVEKHGMGAFVAVVPASASFPPECLVELESSGGTKMRIHLKGVAAPDGAWLRSLFWGGEG